MSVTDLFQIYKMNSSLVGKNCLSPNVEHGTLYIRYYVEEKGSTFKFIVYMDVTPVMTTFDKFKVHLVDINVDDSYFVKYPELKPWLESQVLAWIKNMDMDNKTEPCIWEQLRCSE